MSFWAQLAINLGAMAAILGICLAIYWMDTKRTRKEISEAYRELLKRFDQRPDLSGN